MTATGAGAFSATVQVWQPLATQHLWTALHMARLCDERENELLGLGYTGADVEHQALAMSAVISAACFLETYINEIYAVAADDNKTLRAPIAGVDGRAVELLGFVWKGADVAAEKWTVMDKYQFGLAVAGKPKMDAGRNPTQNAKHLIKLRNTLVHFKPEWQAHDVAHRVEKDLKTVFPGNRLYSGAPWFPAVCLASGCANWACDTSMDFVDTWCEEMGIAARPRDAVKDMAQP
ncbi:hypothetical protein FEK33_03180 [Nocardia asteroides NBRC 15531]|uniref:Uncharacterized protein n=1 Tax=Nocardia asteroides NBRC 15531 TaxID=1110697 RepID=U5EJP3_NOCAS|nr:hypothetical protein [Nocardia asteroides]TLF69322.1 hypothetical protein FEK33_03180 [Nocardia asteroides NBRC 15531]UGT48814.1 hypothetical protein LT345_31015 [Nocardia asteroides]GAD85349.1 hypothetical protein NCAST_31_00430 [Nocardia asteroides NBRC 15531]